MITPDTENDASFCISLALRVRHVCPQMVVKLQGLAMLTGILTVSGNRKLMPPKPFLKALYKYKNS
jgi:hypothetical protein